MFKFRNRRFLKKRKKQSKPIVGYTNTYSNKGENLIEPYIWMDKDEDAHIVEGIVSAADTFDYLQSKAEEPSYEQFSDSTSDYNTPETTYSDSAQTYGTFESYDSGPSSSYDSGSSYGGE